MDKLIDALNDNDNNEMLLIFDAPFTKKCEGISEESVNVPMTLTIVEGKMQPKLETAFRQLAYLVKSKRKVYN